MARDNTRLIEHANAGVRAVAQIITRLIELTNAGVRADPRKS